MPGSYAERKRSISRQSFQIPSRLECNQSEAVLSSFFSQRFQLTLSVEAIG